jgi:hypothetical protein
LLFTHFLGEEKWQLVSEPISQEEFGRRPRVNPPLFEMGITSAQVLKAVGSDDFHGLVTATPPAGKKLTVRLAPLQGHLKAGSRFRFLVETTDYDVLAFEHEGRYAALQRRGKVFEGVLIAPRGNVTLRGRMRGDNKRLFWGLLKYVGE